MTKEPFEAAELIARIQALFTTSTNPYRSRLFTNSARSASTSGEGGSYSRWKENLILLLVSSSFLCYLIERTGSTVPRTELLQSLWGYGAGAFTRTVRYTRWPGLRQKIGRTTPRTARALNSLRPLGVGYKFRGIESEIELPKVSLALPSPGPCRQIPAHPIPRLSNQLTKRSTPEQASRLDGRRLAPLRVNLVCAWMSETFDI